MPTGKPIDDAIRAEVMSAVMAGMGISEAARKYNLSKATVSKIRDNIHSAKRTERTENEIGEANDDDDIEPIDVLLARGLAAHIKFQTQVLTVCANEQYIRTQNAGDLATLLKVSQEHTIRLLEAASAVSDDADDSAEAEET